MPLLLMLARHGETDDNARLVFQGQSGRGLNELGRAQAARLGRRLAADPPFVIVTSDLERAEETARIVADACAASVEVDPGLREVDVGAWTGKGYVEIERDFPEEWAAWERGFDVRRGGGETYAELAARIDRTVAHIVGRLGDRASAEGKGILVVSHGGAIRSWVAKLLGLGTSSMACLGAVTNTSITVVERGAGGAHRLCVWNDSAHLDGLR